jgi:signal transduction histidine kinase
MFSSLRFRLWLTYFLVMGVVLTIAGLAVVVFLLRSPAGDRRELLRLRLVSNLLLQRSQLFTNNLSDLSDQRRLQDLVERADTFSSARIAIFSASGELLADSRRGITSPLPAWSFFAGQPPGAAPIYRDQTEKRQWLYVITPATGGIHLLVAVPRPRLQILEILRDEFLTPFIRGALLALVLAVLLSIWIARWIAAPLQHLEKATREVSLGQFHKIKLEGPREVQGVAQAFNDMGERVQASQRSQRDFVANVSHDLKTPLTSIQGFAQAILDGTADDSGSAKQAAQVIYDEAGRMYGMVLELLDLARLDAGTLSFERAPLDLGVLLKSVVTKFAPQAHQAQVELCLDIMTQTGDLPALVADADRLNQVFSNLVDNALKYTPSGGQVTVSAHPVDGWIEVDVTDSGSGIASDELERIFERFYQTDKARSGGNRRGVGLGLAIAREIVQAHGGKIRAYNLSQINPPAPSGDPTLATRHGSVFVVTLPAVRPDDETFVRKRKDVSSRPRRGL